MKWVLNQPCFMTDNKYDVEAEPIGSSLVIKHEQLFKMIRPVFWPDAGEVDIMAIFKRAIIIVNTVNWLYIKLASEKKVDVPQVRLQSYDFLTAAGTNKMDVWKSGDLTLPADQAENKAWESKWFADAMKGPMPNPEVIIFREPVFVDPAPLIPFAGSSTNRAPFPSIEHTWGSIFQFLDFDKAQAQDEAIKVKTEIEEDFTRKHRAFAIEVSRNRPAYINVDSKITKKRIDAWRLEMAQAIGNKKCKLTDEGSNIWREFLLQGKAQELAKKMVGQSIVVDGADDEAGEPEEGGEEMAAEDEVEEAMPGDEAGEAVEGGEEMAAEDEMEEPMLDYHSEEDVFGHNAYGMHDD